MSYEIITYIVTPILVFALGVALGYRSGKKSGYTAGHEKGVGEAEALGGHCDVCQKLSAKVLVFRQQLICIKCYQAIMSNREMNCRFCNKPVDKCECI